MATTTIENNNHHDRYAVAVLENESLCCVGHLPREISRECYFFLQTRGTIKVMITGERRRSELPQGGLEGTMCFTSRKSIREDTGQGKETYLPKGVYGTSS